MILFKLSQKLLRFWWSIKYSRIGFEIWRIFFAGYDLKKLDKLRKQLELLNDTKK